MILKLFKLPLVIGLERTGFKGLGTSVAVPWVSVSYMKHILV